MLCWVKLQSKGKLTCGCTSQLNHWERSMRNGRAAKCATIACRRGHLVGVQVKKTEGSDVEYYIVPLCLFHGKRGGGVPGE